MSKKIKKGEDTITAIATPLGEGGIGIIRVSGEKAFALLKKIFVPKNKKLKTFQSHRVYLGNLISSQKEILDEVLINVMHAPKTYTTEDMIEINCHGGIEVLKGILQEILQYKGIRLAEPGEFTKRAFLNGRLDLMQAEAVIDLIQAKSQIALKSAARQLQGKGSKKINQIKDSLVDVISPLEASLDFPEDVTETPYKAIADSVDKIMKILAKDLEQLRKIRFVKQGIRIAIVGRANAGKSTLLNAILGRERAIVTSIPGTTRDTLEEPFKIEGIPVIIVDTAGLREAKETIEKEGVKRAEIEIKEADLVLYVVDISKKDNQDLKLISRYTPDKETIFVINKIDLTHSLDIKKLKIKDDSAIFVSAKNEIGIIELKDTIRDFIVRKKTNILEEDLIASNIRHEENIVQALESLEKAREASESELSEEFILFDLKNALNSLGKITGEVTSDDILDKIFSQFCIGK